MNGKRAKQLYKVSVLTFAKEVAPVMEKIVNSKDLTNEQKRDLYNRLPTPRQLYRRLKREYNAHR